MFLVYEPVIQHFLYFSVIGALSEKSGYWLKFGVFCIHLVVLYIGK